MVSTLIKQQFTGTVQKIQLSKKLNQDKVIKRLPDNAYIPSDPSNTDWQAYQAWLAAGNTPLPPA